MRAGAPGDLYVEVVVRPDARFERIESDLIHQVSIGIAEATLGTRVEVPMIEGGSTELEIPAGTQPGAVFRLDGLGVPFLGRRGRGALQVVVVVRVPDAMSEEEAALLRQWADLRGERTDRPASTG
jgi:molecular chaperone DnaJ